jgi:dTDP-4-dehydrorhamnose 3,5-epimerase
MIIVKTGIKGLLKIKCNKYFDQRGYFFEHTNSVFLKGIGFYPDFFQSNISYNKNSLTFRGMHLQKAEFTQKKLVLCLEGMIIDIVVDMREHSETYLKEEYIVLDSSDCNMILIPDGCAHGFITIKDNTIVNYFVDKPYNPSAEFSFNFISLGISKYLSLNKLIISDKDMMAPRIKGLFYD